MTKILTKMSSNAENQYFGTGKPSHLSGIGELIFLNEIPISLIYRRRVSHTVIMVLGRRYVLEHKGQFRGVKK